MQAYGKPKMILYQQIVSERSRRIYAAERGFDHGAGVGVVPPMGRPSNRDSTRVSCGVGAGRARGFRASGEAGRGLPSRRAMRLASLGSTWAGMQGHISHGKTVTGYHLCCLSSVPTSLSFTWLVEGGPSCLSAIRFQFFGSHLGTHNPAARIGVRVEVGVGSRRITRAWATVWKSFSTASKPA